MIPLIESSGLLRIYQMRPSQEIWNCSFWGLVTIYVPVEGILTAVYSVSVVATECGGSESGQAFELLQVPV